MKGTELKATVMTDDGKVLRRPDYNMIIDSMSLSLGLVREYKYKANKDYSYNCPNCGTWFHSRHGKRHYNAGSCTPINTLKRSGYMAFTSIKGNRSVMDIYRCKALRSVLRIGPNGIYKYNYTKLKYGRQKDIPDMVIKKHLRVCMSNILGFSNRKRHVPIIYPIQDISCEEGTVLENIKTHTELRRFVIERIKVSQVKFIKPRGGLKVDDTCNRDQGIGLMIYQSLLIRPHDMGNLKVALLTRTLPP